MRSEGATALAVAAFGVSFIGGMQLSGSSPKPAASAAAAPTPVSAGQADTGLELGSAPALPKLVVVQRAAPKPRAHRTPRAHHRSAPKAATVRTVARPAPAATTRPAPAATAAPVTTAAPAPVRTAVPRRAATPKPTPKPTPAPTFDDHGGQGSGTFANGGGTQP
jgi:hypothetical protein